MPPTPPPVTLTDLAHLDTAELLQRTARLARDHGLADHLDRFIPSYADQTEVHAIKSWILDVTHAPDAGDFVRYKLEITLTAIALRAADRTPDPPGLTIHPLLLSLAAIAGLLDDRGVMWDSTRFQDLAACAPEILAAIERHAAGLPAEDATLAAAILQRVTAAVDDESARSALRAFQHRLDAA